MSHAFDEIRHQENNVIYCNLGKLEGAERRKGPDTPKTSCQMARF